MSKFHKNISSAPVEVVKKRRRPLDIDLFGSTGNIGTDVAEKQDANIDKFLDLINKNKANKAATEDAAKRLQVENQSKAEVFEDKENKSPDKKISHTLDNNTLKVSQPQKHFKSKDREDLSQDEEVAEPVFKGKLGLKYAVAKSKSELERERDSKRVLIQNIDVDEGREIERRSFASIRRAREKAKNLNKERERITREVILPEFITVAELASRMSEKASDVIKEFMKLGTLITVNQTVDADTAEVVILELGHKVKRVKEGDIENILLPETLEAGSEMVKRPPVVTVVGHVDHGKTSLLDALRETSVTTTEAGGITQHIGAYQIMHKSGELITFIDTPGHEAFTAMRSRGVNVTDIVVLVVAADDGIKEQTIEAINHAKAAKVPIIVAINKMDKEGADPTRVVTELLNHELVAESMGGDVMTVKVSALKKINLDKLEDAILLQAEMLELKAPIDVKARGAVIESRIDKARGVVVTLLIQKGILRKGDIVIAGTAFGKVKMMVDDKNQTLEEVFPSTPVEVIGFNTSPNAGDTCVVVQEEKQAREICDYRERKLKEQKNATNKTKSSLETLFMKASNNNTRLKELPVIIKADVKGSAEAIIGSLHKFAHEEIAMPVLHEGIGGINESDIALAKASNAMIIAFNVRASNNAKILAEKEGIEIRYYSIIYELVDDVKRIMSGMLEPNMVEKYLGRAEIRQVFNITKAGKIGGSFVLDGILIRNSNVRLIRDNVVIHEGKLKTLRRFKDDVKEVSSGYECGIAFENYEDIKELDIVEAYEIIEEKREIK